jgi:hypothetical protein
MKSMFLTDIISLSMMTSATREPFTVEGAGSPTSRNQFSSRSDASFLEVIHIYKISRVGIALCDSPVFVLHSFKFLGARTIGRMICRTNALP